MRIAVVGTGIAGLTFAHILRADPELVVYEGATRPGGHANTIRVTDSAGAEHWMDTGFIVLNERNYPHFEDLLSEIGVETTPSAREDWAGNVRGLGEEPARRAATSLPATRRSRCR